MNLLFITHSDLTKRAYGDGSTRYRCFNVAEVAHAHGHSAQVVALNALRLKDLAYYDLISWLRPEPGRKTMAVLNRAAALNIPCVADVDDLIFDPLLAAESPAVVNGFTTCEHIEKRFAGHADTLKHFSAITVSTTALAQHVKTCFSDMPVATVHNGLSNFWLAHADISAGMAPTQKSLVYLPGTRSHDQDLASISLPLNQWLQSRADVRLDIVGKIAIDEHLQSQNNVNLYPWVDYYQLPALMRRHSCCIAPLKKSRFNAAKSHVKFIESAALGIPLIASPNDDLLQHDCPGLSFAETSQDWYNAFLQAGEIVFREIDRISLQEYARTQCTAAHYASPLIKTWEQGHLLPTKADTPIALPLARVA